MTSDTHNKYVYDAHINSTFIASYDITPKKLINFLSNLFKIIKHRLIICNDVYQQWAFIEEGNSERILQMEQGLGACFGERSLSSSCL